MKLKKNNAWIYAGAGFSLFLIAYCLIYIFNYYSSNDILLHYPKNYMPDNQQKLTPNEIGDSIGGVLNPIIGLVASILTFLAFYMQKKANDQIQDQFKVQQFESKFYEMLRLHKENVDEIEIKSVGNSTPYAKRQAFVSMTNDFNLLLRYVSDQNTLTEADFKNAYGLLFWGWGNLDHDALSSSWYKISVGPDKEGSDYDFVVDFREHDGYGSILGHYYRHLFMMVKFVGESDTLMSYEEKIKYLKMLRAQLSNHEQIMLFYNWLSGYGDAWENEANHFFTEYRMIHNLWKDELYQNQFILDKVTGLENKPVKLRTKPLFEYQEQ